jgi:hypothetical protein
MKILIFVKHLGSGGKSFETARCHGVVTTYAKLTGQTPVDGYRLRWASAA